MYLPVLIKDTIPNIKGLVGNIDDLALINVINAKITNMITQLGVSFRQYKNSIPATLSYYGINFMNSGANKDYIVDCINNYLMPFVEKEIKEQIEKYKNDFKNSNIDLKQKELDEELQKIRVANYEIYNPNYTGLYKEAEQISKIKFGSLFIRIGELGDYLDSIVSGNQSKKELYQKLKDIYEGTIAPSIIAGDNKREILKKIPVQALMYSDFENLLDEKIKKYYLMSLKTGIARRSFIYMPINDKNKIDYPMKPSEQYRFIENLVTLQLSYFKLFEIIKEKENKLYELTDEASDHIYQYRCECIDYFNNSNDNIITKLETKESFWKIHKLAIVYGIIDNPNSNLIDVEYVKMAISFYKAIRPSLKAIIEKRNLNEIEKFAEFLFNNKDKEYITSMELRKTNIVKSSAFKKVFIENIDDINEELETNYGYSLFAYDGLRGNSKAYYLKRKS